MSTERESAEGAGAVETAGARDAGAREREGESEDGSARRVRGEDPGAAHGSAPGCELLLIGGGAGVGKTSVAWEVSVLLRADRLLHCLIEGDFMDQIHPAPEDDPRRTAITERNIAAVWANYAALGQRRLIYTNTVSVLPEEGEMIARAMGGGAVAITRVLLTAKEATVRDRLGRREIGSQFAPHLERSLLMARRLEEQAPLGTTHVPTDGRSVQEIAVRVLDATGWRLGR